MKNIVYIKGSMKLLRIMYLESQVYYLINFSQNKKDKIIKQEKQQRSTKEPLKLKKSIWNEWNFLLLGFVQLHSQRQEQK